MLGQEVARQLGVRFIFVEKEEGRPSEEEPGFKRFLRDRVLSGDAAEEEIQFLKRLQFSGRRPTPLYYYRELQNLRDPLHFRAPLPEKGKTKRGRKSRLERSVAPMHKYHEGTGIEKQLQFDGRKKAVQRWAENKPKGRKTR